MVPFTTAVLLQLPLNGFEYRRLNDRFMLSFMDQIFVANQTGVKGIGQKGIDRAFIERFSPSLQAAFGFPFFVAPSQAVAGSSTPRMIHRLWDILLGYGTASWRQFNPIA